MSSRDDIVTSPLAPDVLTRTSTVASRSAAALTPARGTLEGVAAGLGLGVGLVVGLLLGVRFGAAWILYGLLGGLVLGIAVEWIVLRPHRPHAPHPQAAGTTDVYASPASATVPRIAASGTRRSSPPRMGRQERSDDTSELDRSGTHSTD